ncbi:hypothetical protein EYC80_003896 [Monilinia laxa]|uniref:Uncharacterized protein n=1 Tax=Monilinia laxa TaxID=61186 RepID=A0A5N6KN35_MONLA|nr:hypothetical protein EYC80_003896 [Monilinia laxa]
MPSFAAGGNFQPATENPPSGFASPSTSNEAANGSVHGLDVVSAGYMVSPDAAANKYLFFQSGFYDASILTYAESGKQSVTQGELLALGSLPMVSDFAGRS